MRSWKMKSFTFFLVGLGLLLLVFNACESKKDPFSSLNKQPVIDSFSFDQDSLKFTQQSPFKLTLKYQDEENQQLTATFKFVSGKGDIYDANFKQIEKSDDKIVFDVPSSFDGKINFIPDTTGKVEIEMELSDRVKLTTKLAETFFFKNLEPVALFNYQLLSNVRPYNVEVDASESYDQDEGQIKWYYWRFDDGSPLVKTGSKTYQHSYQNAGSYTIRLTVEDDDGAVDSTEQAVSTNNQPPVASLQISPQPPSGPAPFSISYTATGSYDPDGTINTYRIDLGNGISRPDSTGSYTYNVDGNFRVKLTVTDNLGATDTTSILVTVATPPVAILTVAPNEGPFPLECLINGNTSYDPQGGLLDHDIYIDGTLVYDNVDSVLHTFTDPKTYLVRLLVTSQRNGLTSQITKSVTATNLNPVAEFNWVPQNPGHLQPVTYTSTSYDSNLTDQISYYKWTFPQGDTLAGPNRSIVTKAFDAGQNPYQVKLEVWDKYRGTPYAGYATITKTVFPGDAPGTSRKK